MDKITICDLSYMQSSGYFAGMHFYADATFLVTGSCFDGNLGYSTNQEYPTRPTKRQIRAFKRKLRKAPKVNPYEFD